MKIWQKAVRYLKKPSLYNVVLILEDFDLIPVLVELRVAGYELDLAEAYMQAMIKKFNYEHTTNYKLDKIYKLNQELVVEIDGKETPHYKVGDLYLVGYQGNWQILKANYDELKMKYLSEPTLC